MWLRTMIGPTEDSKGVREWSRGVGRRIGGRRRLNIVGRTKKPSEGLRKGLEIVGSARGPSGSARMGLGIVGKAREPSGVLRGAGGSRHSRDRAQASCIVCALRVLGGGVAMLRECKSTSVEDLELLLSHL